MDKKLEIVASENELTVLYDKDPLFIKTRLGYWVYIKGEEGSKIHEQIPNFNKAFTNIFIEDISNQLEEGIDRNSLTINIPREIKLVKIGDRTIQLEV
jgi:hypothetical protein